MLQLPNFGHMITSPIQFESRDKRFLMRSLTEIMTSSPLFQNIFILRRPRVAIFDDIIKIVTCLLKKYLKTPKKIKRFRNYVQKCNYICIS